MKRELAKAIRSDELADLFELLDLDASGEIQVDEFIEGLSKIMISKEPLDSVREKKQVAKLSADVSKILKFTVDQFSNVDQRRGFGREKSTREDGADPIGRSEQRRPIGDSDVSESQMHQAIVSMTEVLQNVVVPDEAEVPNAPWHGSG